MGKECCITLCDANDGGSAPNFFPCCENGHFLCYSCYVEVVSHAIQHKNILFVAIRCPKCKSPFLTDHYYMMKNTMRIQDKKKVLEKHHAYKSIQYPWDSD